jgi:hypothetical protein
MLKYHAALKRTARIFAYRPALSMFDGAMYFVIMLGLQFLRFYDLPQRGLVIRRATRAAQPRR